MAATPAPIRALAVAAAVGVAVSGCTSPSPGGPTDPANTLVLADTLPEDGYNPIAGYGLSGESKIYEGLVRLEGGEGLPTFEPALATSDPKPNDDATVWTVDLRTDVTFSDGSGFDAHDVVATYEAILDPKSASSAVTSFEMIDTVEALDDHTVQFHLHYPYAAFRTRLLIGVVPAESVTKPGPVAKSPLNKKPVGTGPYELTDLTADKAVLTARDDYWGKRPQIRRLTLLNIPDDDSRAQRIVNGELDGASLPPVLANNLDVERGVHVATNPTADWRGVSLPEGAPVTGDRAIRTALNYAVDRDAVVKHVLGGHGAPAHTPFPQEYGTAHNPKATFTHDPAKARRVLDAAGWTPTSDGTRTKGGIRAQFTLMYPAADTLRRDVAQAFASDAKKIGVTVDLEALSWDRIEPRLHKDAVLLGGGDEPYDPDTQAYKLLHSKYTEPGAGSTFDNPSRYRNRRVDTLLDRARRSTDPAARAADYRAIQSELISDPPAVFIAFLDHTYLVSDSNWKMSGHVLEPHAHGVAWGPWWAVQDWTR